MATVSAAGLALGFSGGLYGNDPRLALGARQAKAGLLVPGLLGQDLFNLAVAAPLLLGSMWLARRRYLTGLLLWPGAGDQRPTHYWLVFPPIVRDNEDNEQKEEGYGNSDCREIIERNTWRSCYH